MGMCDWGKRRGREWGKKKRKLDVPFVALPRARLFLRTLSPRLSRGKCKAPFSEQFARSPNQPWLMLSQSNCFLKVRLLMQISRSFPWSPFPSGNTHEHKSIKNWSSSHLLFSLFLGFISVFSRRTFLTEEKQPIKRWIQREETTHF